MTREEAKTVFLNRGYVEVEGGTIYDANKWREACVVISKLLEQESFEDEYIKVPKKALKYRTAGMVAYNAEWLKNHFDMERAVICGAQEPCEDCINRQAAINIVKDMRGLARADVLSDAVKQLKELPPITPQPCEDAISREDVIALKWQGEASKEFLEGYASAVEDARVLPPAAPQQKTGLWIDDKCSICGKGIEDLISSNEWYRNEEPKLCPFCGAKMQAESEDKDAYNR